MGEATGKRGRLDGHPLGLRREAIPRISAPNNQPSAGNEGQLSEFSDSTERPRTSSQLSHSQTPLTPSPVRGSSPDLRPGLPGRRSGIPSDPWRVPDSPSRPSTLAIPGTKTPSNDLLFPLQPVSPALLYGRPPAPLTIGEMALVGSHCGIHCESKPFSPRNLCLLP